MKWSKTEKFLIPVGVVLVVAAAALMFGSSSRNHQKRAPAPRADQSHGKPFDPSRMPAFQAEAAGLNNLPPTLPPERFTGQTREAYKAAGEIPRTIAQLPCYCYCDEGHGHKSLHSCFEGTHGSQCAVCVDEALLAYRLEKEQGMGPAQIREVIVAKYSSRQ